MNIGKGMSGSTEECWAHYVQYSEVTDPDHPERRRAADYLQVAPDRIRQLCKEGVPTKGLTTVLLPYLLRDTGYIVTDLQELQQRHPIAYDLGDLVARQVVTYQEVIDLFGESDGTMTLKRMRGRAHFRPREQRDKVKAFIATQHLSLKDHTAKQVKEVPIPDVVTIGAMLVTTLMPIVDYLLSSECSAENRAAFRSAIGEREYFNFATDVNRLCGERIRSM